MAWGQLEQYESQVELRVEQRVQAELVKKQEDSTAHFIAWSMRLVSIFQALLAEHALMKFPWVVNGHNEVVYIVPQLLTTSHPYSH